MVRALVVDDEQPARERLIRLLGALGDVECVGEAGDGATALEMIDRLRPDVVFLDIQMPEMDGLSVAALLGDDGPSVVFATAFEQHAIRAFELAAVDYLLKPIDVKRLRAALDRVQSRAGAPAELARAVLRHLEPSGRKMAVRAGAKYVVFDIERIAAVIAQDHYAAILVDGRELLSDDSLDQIMARLADSRFLRVHRSAIVNTAFVAELRHDGDRKYVAILSDAAKTNVPIARDRLDELKAKLGAN